MVGDGSCRSLEEVSQRGARREQLGWERGDEPIETGSMTLPTNSLPLNEPWNPPAWPPMGVGKPLMC